MNKFILLFCMVIAATGNSWADQNFVDPTRGPTMEEYQAAMVVVRRYLADQKAAIAAARLTTDNVVSEDDVFPLTEEDGDPEDGDVIRELISPGFSVFGSANVEAATVTAIAADGNDGALVVGNTVVNQPFSGRLVFDETATNYLTTGFCGMQFRYDGALNLLRLEEGCNDIPTPKIVIPRDGPTLFYESIGIGGSFFDGSRGGGLLMLSFVANDVLSCDTVCSSHRMTCELAAKYYVYGNPTHVPSTCDETISMGSGAPPLGICHCSNSSGE